MIEATQRTHALDCDMDEDCACSAGCDEGDDPARQLEAQATRAVRRLDREALLRLRAEVDRLLSPR